jgi:hypothetical protein
MMRKLRALAILGALGLVLPSCGGDEFIPTFAAEIFSDPLADGDIGFYPDPPPDGTYTVSQAEATGNVLFGIDVDGTEFRAFLDFPLDGSTGGDAVPFGAAILSADVDLFVNDVALASAVPTLVDLVPFPITGLTPTDFDSLPIATRAPFDFFRSDLGAFVRVDVTPLMVEAQRRGFADLQLRFLLDFVPEALGLVEIDDELASSAPLLTVEYQ